VAQRAPNLLILVTDQQRYPQHWPEDPDWLRSLTPNDAELARTGLTFRRAFAASCMCSPSRASMLTGTFPARHGVTLTLTCGDLQPDPRNVPDVVRTVGQMLATGEAGRARTARAFLRGLVRGGPHGGHEPELLPLTPSLGPLLRAAGYHVAYKGKWHLTKPLAGGERWGAADAERLERDFGLADWEPPDAGGTAKAHDFGGGGAGRSGAGWDEDYTRQAEAWLGRADLPEPFCLVVSLINPHDVLGYPNSYERGGYHRDQFRDLGVPLPPTLDEDLRDKPTVQALTRLGQTAYLGAVRGREAQQDYVNFYAYLHGVADAQIGRVLRLLGDPGDPRSLRARTVVVRTSDHGELGLSHGGLRQKMFNAYEETIHIPLVVSNPILFPRAAETDALASHVDLVPTLLGLAGASRDGLTFDGVDLAPILARHAAPDRDALEAAGVDMTGLARDAPPAERVREEILFTYDDHQAATAQTDAPGQPNRIRCIRDGRWKYAAYVDPRGRVAPEFECYDLERDPLEARNLVDPATGRGRDAEAEAARRELGERLVEACRAVGVRVAPPPAPSAA